MWHIPTSRGLLGLTPLPLSVLTLQQVSHLESDECNCYSAIQTVQGFTTCTIYSLEALGQDARYVFNPSNCHFFVMIYTLCIEAIIYVFPAGLHCSCISHLANNLNFCTWQDIWLNFKLPPISYRSYSHAGDDKMEWKCQEPSSCNCTVEVPDLGCRSV